MGYSDHDGEIPLWPEALVAMAEAAALGGNPSSLHRLGQKARRYLDDAVVAVRSLVGTCRAEVIFTSGAEESNALALWGLAHARRAMSPHGRAKQIVCDPWSMVASGPARCTLEMAGFDIVVLPVEPATGRIDAACVLAPASSPIGLGTALVSLCATEPVTGAIQPIDAISAAARAAGAWLHVDAVQSAGRVDLNFDGWGVDAMSLSSRPLGGPPGVGALVLRPGVDPQPLWYGGGQERGLRPGTQPVALAVGMGRAASMVLKRLANRE